jgi:hypothetical protein
MRGAATASRGQRRGAAPAAAAAAARRCAGPRQRRCAPSRYLAALSAAQLTLLLFTC